MKKLKIALVVLLICLTAAVFGEETEVKPDVYNNAIGFVYTPSSPIDDYAEKLTAGLQFQHWFDNIGFSLTGSMYYDQKYDYGAWNEESRIGPKLDWKILAGAQFVLCTFNVDNLHWIKNDTVLRLYFWVDGGLGARDLDVDMKNCAYLFAGTGIGCESVFWKHISFPFELGYYGQFLNNGGFGITCSAGIRFRF